MNANKLIAIALAALLVFAGGAAALPGNAPDGSGADAADDHQPDDADDQDGVDDDANETEVEANETAEEDEHDENASDGPPTAMPEQVPDHVSEIHQLVRDKLNGDLGNTTLGEAISGLVGGGDGAESQADADDAAANAGPGQSNADSAGPVRDLPQQAADHVSAIHDAITSFLHGDGGNPGDEVSSAAQG